jgi:hypothetical protein
MHCLASQHRLFDLVEFHIGGEPTTPSSRWSRRKMPHHEISLYPDSRFLVSEFRIPYGICKIWNTAP